ncbi:KAP family P-loop NTPase fold protein [Nocardia sp. NPDC003693]
MNHEQTVDASAAADREIQTMAEDRLDRAEFATSVAERIMKAGVGPSVVFGLTGPWGSGKTSVLKMIDQAICARTEGEWAVVYFTPWSAGDTYTLTEEFYRVIASAMPSGEKGDAARKLLAAAAPALSAVLKAGAKSLMDKHLGDGFVKDATAAVSDAIADKAGEFQAADEPDPFIDRFNKVSEAVKSAGKNVLVVVDDVDRLHSDELLSVMKAVRLLGRFDSVHYLLSYDEQTVIDVLTGTDISNQKPNRARKYLEKIVQFPFALPPIQQVHLANELHAHLLATAKRCGVSLILTDLNEETISPEDFDTIFSLLSGQHLTLRSVYRLCNQVDILLSLIGGTNVDFVDAVLVTFIRLEFPDVYSALPRWRKDLVGASYPTHWLGGSTPSDDDRRKSWQEVIAKAMGLISDASEVESVYRILCAMFYEIPSPKSFYVASREPICGIRNDTHFDRYFAFRIPIGDLSDADVRDELKFLVENGEWSESSLIRQCLEAQDEPMRRLLRGKIVQSLDVVAAAPPSQCLDAAALITRSIPDDNVERELIFGRWSHVIYALIGHAISSLSSRDGEIAADKYRADFGLLITVGVLSRPIELPTVSHDKVVAATRGIRKEVAEICVADLSNESINGHGYSILSFFHYLDSDLWSELHAKVQGLLTVGDLSVLDVAARFVSMSRAMNLGTGVIGDRIEFHRFELSEFEFLIPREQWLASGVSEAEPEAIDFQDASLSNRKKYAASALRKVRLESGS